MFDTETLVRMLVCGALLGAVGVVALAFLLPGRFCPTCSSPLPRFRLPRSLRQALCGGWTCAACGTECDRRGRARA